MRPTRGLGFVVEEDNDKGEAKADAYSYRKYLCNQGAVIPPSGVADYECCDSAKEYRKGEEASLLEDEDREGALVLYRVSFTFSIRSTSSG